MIHRRIFGINENTSLSENSCICPGSTGDMTSYPTVWDFDAHFFWGRKNLKIAHRR